MGPRDDGFETTVDVDLKESFIKSYSNIIILSKFSYFLEE